MAGNSLIGNLAVTLGLNTAAFQRGVTIAEKRVEAMRSRFAAVSKSVSGMGAALGAGILVAGLSNAARGAFEMASALSESAEKAGVTVEALQELRFAAQQSGVSQEQLFVALNRLNKSMGELSLGKKTAVDAFAAIGLAAEDLKGKAPEEALRIVADALNKLPDVQQRVAIGSQLMGKSFSTLLPLINGGSKALDDYATAARKSGIITAEEAKQLDDMADSWDATKLKIQVATAKIIAWFGSLEKGVYQWYAFRDKVLAAVGDTVSGIGQTLTNRLNAIWDNVSKKIEWIGGKFKWLYDVVVGHSYIPDMVAGIAAEMAKLDAVMVGPAQAATGKTAEAFRQLQQATSDLLDRLFPEASAFNALQADIKTLEDAMKRGILTADQYNAALERLQSEHLNDQAPDVLSMGADDLVTNIAGIEAVVDGMSQVVSRSQEWGNIVSQVGYDLAQIGGDFLSRFVDGTAKLKDLWRALATYAIQFLTSSGSPLMGLFGGARASGGPVMRGKTYLVGERGPELFSPGVSGQIMSNSDSRALGSGVTYNIYTPDADSFRRNERQISRDTRRRLGVG